MNSDEAYKPAPHTTPPAAARPLELVIFIGVQGSGKTTYYRSHFAATHVHVSKDLMTGARDREQRQRNVIDQALASGSPVVVDNTNPTMVVRAPLIEIAKRYGARVIAYHFQVPVKVAVERNRQREGKARVPDVVIYVTSRKIVAPVAEEGFDEIRIVAEF